MSWETVRLGSTVKIRTGKLDANASSLDGIYPFFTCAKEPLRINSFSYNCECVLVAGNGDLNVKYYKGKFDAYQRTYIVESLDSEKISTRYLFYFLDVYLEKLREQSIGGVIKYIKLENLTEAPIPLPPLATQKRIAEILDAADALRRKDQELLKKYDELAQAIFIDMFGDPVKNEMGWDKVELSYFIACLETGVSVNSNDDAFDITKKCVLKTSCVYTGYFNSAQAKVIAPLDLDRAKLNPVKDSIIISRMNTSELVGMSAYIDKDYPNLYLPDRLWMTVKSENPHSSLWLSFALKSFVIREQIQKIASGTSGSMKNISKKDFLEIEIINPPYKLQKTFEDALIKINELKKFDKVNEGNILFDSLIQKAFSGELVA